MFVNFETNNDNFQYKTNHVCLEASQRVSILILWHAMQIFFVSMSLIWRKNGHHFYLLFSSSGCFFLHRVWLDSMRARVHISHRYRHTFTRKKKKINKKKEGRQETIFDTKISIYCLILNDDMTFSRTETSFSHSPSPRLEKCVSVRGWLHGCTLPKNNKAIAKRPVI